MTRVGKTEDFSLRISGGKAKGRKIAGPSGVQLRPTGAKVRQAFFNILGNKLKGCSFLDLCAGTGIMGIEALSRGAESLLAVEADRKTARAIESNLRQLAYDGEVICADTRKALPALSGQSFDIIFADPPYKSEISEGIVRLVDEHDLLSEDGLLVIEHLKNLPPPECMGKLQRISMRNYGQTSLSFYQKTGASQELAFQQSHSEAAPRSALISGAGEAAGEDD